MTGPAAPTLPPVVKGRCGCCAATPARLYPRGWRCPTCAPTPPPNPNPNVIPLTRKAA